MPLAAGTTIDDTTWAALALILTILGAAYTWFAWRRSGLAAGMRGLAWTLLPVAAWLTGSLKLVTGIVEDIVNWAAKLVFSPVVWLGIVVAGVAVALWVPVRLHARPWHRRTRSGPRVFARPAGRKSAPGSAETAHQLHNPRARSLPRRSGGTTTSRTWTRSRRS